MNQEQFLVETGLVLKTCPECGITYAVPKKFNEAREEDHGTFYCPGGHALYYPQKTRARYYKGQLTKMKNQLNSLIRTNDPSVNCESREE